MQATLDDVPDIFDVSRQTWSSTYQSKEYNITEQDQVKIDGPQMQKIILKRQDEIKQNPWSYRIAKCEDKIVGYAWARKHRDLNELFAIYILSEFQGKGIWKRLIEKIFEYLWKDKPIILQVIWYNTQAISFYQKNGFVFQKKLPDRELVQWKFVPEIQMIYDFKKQ